MRRNNAGLFWPVLVLVTALDILTKAWAVGELVPQRIRHAVLGDWVSFTLVYNPGAAFGLHVGQYSRWIFTVLTVAALAVLGRLYTRTRPGDVARVLALALVCGGAAGNLLDRLRSGMGVVDFIDIGVGDARWPTFNLADVAVSLGAILLAWTLWQEDRMNLAAARAAAPAGAAAPASMNALRGDQSELS